MINRDFLKPAIWFKRVILISHVPEYLQHIRRNEKMRWKRISRASTAVPSTCFMTVHNITRVSCTYSRCYIDYFQFQYNTQQVVKITLGVLTQSDTCSIRVAVYIWPIRTNGLVSFGYFKLQLIYAGDDLSARGLAGCCSVFTALVRENKKWKKKKKLRE